MSSRPGARDESVGNAWQMHVDCSRLIWRLQQLDHSAQSRLGVPLEAAATLGYQGCVLQLQAPADRGRATLFWVSGDV